MAFILNKLGNQFKQTIHLINGSFNLIITNQYRFLASNSGKNPFPQYVNLPPISPLSGKGHTFETRIERKRKIEDPNLPSLNSIGELKWATTRMLRDVRRRRVFIDYYPFRQCYYNMRKNQTLPQSVRVSLNLLLFSFHNLANILFFFRFYITRKKHINWNVHYHVILCFIYYIVVVL